MTADLDAVRGSLRGGAPAKNRAAPGARPDAALMSVSLLAVHDASHADRLVAALLRNRIAAVYTPTVFVRVCRTRWLRESRSASFAWSRHGWFCLKPALLPCLRAVAATSPHPVGQSGE